MDKLGLVKTHIKTTYDCPSYLTKYQRDIIHYAISAYSYLLPTTGSFDYDTFADYIDRHYDTKHGPQNKEVVSVLRSVNQEHLAIEAEWSAEANMEGKINKGLEG